MSKALKTTVAVVALAMTLVGCGMSEQDSDKPESSVGTEAGVARTPSTVAFTQTLPDGREVLCIYAISVGSRAGGLSCDW